MKRVLQKRLWWLTFVFVCFKDVTIFWFKTCSLSDSLFKWNFMLIHVELEVLKSKARLLIKRLGRWQSGRWLRTGQNGAGGQEQVHQPGRWTRLSSPIRPLRFWLLSCSSLPGSSFMRLPPPGTLGTPTKSNSSPWWPRSSEALGSYSCCLGQHLRMSSQGFQPDSFIKSLLLEINFFNYCWEYPTCCSQ